MKKLFITIAILLYAFSALALSPLEAKKKCMAAKGKAAAAASEPDVYYESFNPTFSTSCATAPGYTYQDLCDNETVAGDPVNVLDQDSATAYDGEALDIDINDTTAVIHTSDTFTEQTGAAYYGFRIYISSTWGGTDAWNAIFTLQDATSPVILVDVMKTWDPYYQLRFTNDDSAQENAANVSADAWHTVCLYYASDGSTVPQYSVDGGALDDIATGADNNQSPDGFFFGSDDAGELNLTTNIFIDDVGVCSSGNATLCYCP